MVPVDPSMRMLEQAAATTPAGVSFVVGAAEALPLRTGSFDVVFLSMVAHHFVDLALSPS